MSKKYRKTDYTINMKTITEILLGGSEPCYYEVYLFDGKIWKTIYREYNCIYRLFFDYYPAIYIYGKNTRYNKDEAKRLRHTLKDQVDVYIYLSEI